MQIEDRIMRNENRFVMAICVAAAMLAGGWLQNECGDGACQNMEEWECLRDCEMHIAVYRYVYRNQPEYKVKSITILREKGGRVDWSHSNNLIAFDKLGPDGFYDVYTAKPDWSDERCITCDHPDLPNRNMGQPAYHPSGKYLVFQAENEHSKNTRNEFLSLGINNDLYLITADGKSCWQLTDNPEGYASLHPKFSHDGLKLLWAERYEGGRGSRWGHWRLKLADFDEKDHCLKNIRDIQPVDGCWYESHGFSLDDRKLYFSGNLDGGSGNDIYSYELGSGTLSRLTDDKNIWDEMAELSPECDKIAFISNRFEPESGRLGFLTLKTEIYLMDPDGTNIEQITHLNDKTHSYLIGDLTWSPDGKKILAVAYERKQKTAVLIQVEFE